MKTPYSFLNPKYLLSILLLCFSYQANAQLQIVGCFIDYNDNSLTKPKTDIYKPYTKLDGCIAIGEISFDAEQTLNIGSQASGAGAGKIQFNDLVIKKNVDVASPLLFLSMASGKPFKSIVFFFFKKMDDVNNKGDYTALMTVQLGLAAIRKMSVGGASGEDFANAETISIQYGQIQISVYPFDDNGIRQTPVINGWDRVKNVQTTLPALDPK